MIELLMGRVEDHLKKLSVSSDSAYIFRRTTPGTADTDRAYQRGLARNDLFETKFMLPIVTEIVLVGEGVAFLLENTIQPHAALIQHFDVVIFIEIGVAPDLSVLLQLMKMRVGPSKNCLEGIMQTTQQNLARHLNASPNWWLDPEQGHLQFVDGVGGWHGTIV
jgi:hypothetical protein